VGEETELFIYINISESSVLAGQNIVPDKCQIMLNVTEDFVFLQGKFGKDTVKINDKV
jgi:hypothetical protein